MSRIANLHSLAVSDLRTSALALAEAAYTTLDIGTALARVLRIEGDTLYHRERAVSLSGRRVFFVGVGKCAFASVEPIEKLLGDHLTRGITLDPSPLPGTPPAKIVNFKGTHPLPSEENEQATNEIFSLLSNLSGDDLVIFLISGGGSTLLCSHEAPMTCADEALLFKELTHKGASIQEINTVRKHTSRARGGGLARAAAPAEVLSLIVSDVPGNDLEYISSAPTLLDTSTVEDARAVLEKYGIPTTSPLTLLETEKDPAYFKRVTNDLILTNLDALHAMEEKARELGYETTLVTDHLVGESQTVAREIVERLHATAGRVALLYAGETTVTIQGEGGEGGRNQELALAAAQRVVEHELVLSFASDGHDNSPHAGAFGDTLVRTHAEEQGLSIDDALLAHDSYTFFAKSGDALTTGYTGSNVSDFIIGLRT